MTEYKVQSAKLEIRTCEVHNDQPYILGCKVCLNIACVKCVSNLDICRNGKGELYSFYVIFVTLNIKQVYEFVGL